MNEQMNLIYDFLEINIHDKKYKKLPQSFWIGTIPWEILMWIFSVIIDVALFTGYELHFRGVFVIFFIDFIMIAAHLFVVAEISGSNDYIYNYDGSGKKRITIYLGVSSSIVVFFVKYLSLIILHMLESPFYEVYYDTLRWALGDTLLGLLVRLVLVMLYYIVYDFSGMYVLSSICGFIARACLSGVCKREISIWRSVAEYNENLYQSMQEKERMYPLHQMLEHKVIQPVMKAIRYYNEENYEDALANVRKSLEFYLREKLLYNNVFFSETEEISIFNLIVYFAKKDDFFEPAALHEVRRNCNQGVHVLRNELDTSSDREKTKRSIKIMLEYISEAQSILMSNEEYLTRMGHQITLYVEKADKHIECGEYEDALLNFRQILECVVNGYMHHFSIVCTYGYSTDLSGFIDTLFANRCITEKSQKNMHYIRKMGNKSAHGNEGGVGRQKTCDMFELVKNEILTYERSLENQGNLSSGSLDVSRNNVSHSRSEKKKSVCQTEDLEEEKMRIIADKEVFEIFGTDTYKTESGDYDLSLYSRLHEIVVQRLCYEEVDEIITELYEKGKMNLNNHKVYIRVNLDRNKYN